MKKLRKAFISIMMAFLLAIQLVPMQVFAATNNLSIRVIVENNTFLEPVDGFEPTFTGTLVDTIVEVPRGSNGMDALLKSLDKEGIDREVQGGSYVSSINGMGEFDGGYMSGWMVTANDWFTNTGINDYQLENNDEIKFMYTCAYGQDLGGSWENNDKTVKDIKTDVGILSPNFDKDTKEYTLTVPKGTSDVVVTPTASNKNFQVRSSVNGVEYKRIQKIPVAEGTVITVKCGDPSWPSMNNQTGGTGEAVPAQVYKITVKEEKQSVDVTFDSDNGSENIVKEVSEGETLDYNPENPTKEGYTFVGWFKDTDDITTEYKNNQTYTENATYKAKWAHVTMLGAQAKSVVNDKSGIRFGTKIYNDGDTVVSKGTLILPANLLQDGEQLTLDTAKVAKSEANVLYEVNEKENYVTYLGTIVNIPSTQFDRKMTAASYVVYKDKQGNEYTVYAPYANGSISVSTLLNKK